MCCPLARFFGPNQDLHSGSFGGAVNNPAIALSKFLASIVDQAGQIQLPNFYDPVIPLEQSERDMWNGLAFSDREFAEQLGVTDLLGEEQGRISAAAIREHRRQ